MLQIKIGNEKYPIDKFEIFKTQFGNDAIRIIGDTPLAEGFELYDNDDLIGDMSEYIYLFREDDTCKEYTKVEDEIIPPETYASGDVPINPIQRQISALNRRITAITPYTATKYGYFGETEKVFYNVPSGNVTVFCDAENTFSRIEDRLIVKFADRLADTTEITVMVQ